MLKRFSEMEYARPDIEKVHQEVRNTAAALRTASSYEETCRILMDHKAAQAEYATMRAIARIRNSVDTTDSFYEAEMGFFHSQAPKLALLLKDVNDALLESPFRKELENEFGTLFFHNLEVHKRFADERIVDDQIEESRLVQQYFKVTAVASTCFRGEKCNFYGLLKHMQSTDRDLRREAFQAWAALYESISGELDALYDKMVHLRHGMAQKLGFASYTEMAYLLLERYDYTPADAENFRHQIKSIVTPACEKLFRQQAQRLGVDQLRYYDESLVYPEGNAVPQGTRDELVAKAQQMYRAMSPETGEFFDNMVTYDLFDLESKPGKQPGGYCSTLPAYKLPFIFANFNGTSADMNVLTHEAGHAFQAYLSYRTQPFYDITFSTSEICEIHSMSMEHFTYPWMELFFEDKADKYRYAHLVRAVTTLPYLVSVDEYQHCVFENPDMTAMERRAAWREIEKAYMPWRDYDGNEFLEQGGFWMQKQHIFMEPFYYIEYALAQMGAFEFYVLMKKDREKAWADYCRLCRAGGSKGYFQLLELAGLSNPFRDGSVEKVVSGILEELNI